METKEIEGERRAEREPFAPQSETRPSRMEKRGTAEASATSWLRKVAKGDLLRVDARFRAWLEYGKE